MSEPLSPTPPKTVDDVEDEDSQEALLFARCSPPAAETKAPDEDPKRPQHRESTAASNHRRSHLTGRQLLIASLIALVTSLCVGLLLLIVGGWFYNSRIVPRLSGAPAASAVKPAGSASTSEQALQDALAKSAEQIAALQKQVDVMRREQLLTQQNTRQSLENISATLKNPQLVPAAPAATGEPGVPRMADAKLEVSPTQEEFIQLKERNRLTQYADEAIATGERRPLELLVEYMRDPQLPHLHDAAKAEFMRAVRAVQILQREEPGYRLPVAEIFKGDTSIRDDADVKPEALLKLLADTKQPWEVRLRVCFLLISSPLPQTNAALIKAIKEDPSLDVAKHAQLALEQRIKKRFRLFDIPAIDEWFQSQEK